MNFGLPAVPGMLAKTGGSHINTQILRARIANSRSVWIAAIAIPLMLLAPALWNGYPLLQWDTGGYLARWYEGYLVPSRSTVFGLYLHYGEDSGFWINLGIQALATLWILLAGVARQWLCLRGHLGLARSLRRALGLGCDDGGVDCGGEAFRRRRAAFIFAVTKSR